jgi:hypothetical protein
MSHSPAPLHLSLCVLATRCSFASLQRTPMSLSGPLEISCILLEVQEFDITTACSAFCNPFVTTGFLDL